MQLLLEKIAKNHGFCDLWWFSCFWHDVTYDVTVASYKVCLYFFWYQWTRECHSYPLVPHTWCFVNQFPRSWGGGIRPRLWDGSKKPGSFRVKWSRGSLWTLKSVFARQRENAEYPEAAVSWLSHAYHPRSSGMCLKIKIKPNRAVRCAAIALRSYGPRWPPTGRHSTKIIFHIQVTFDLWWLYINVDLWYYHILILIKIN